MKREVKNKSLKKIAVVFCGLIRAPDLFRKSIEEMVEFRENNIINKIIFSTWDYEIDKYPEMRKFFVDNKINLIESKEPEERGIGNIWCQMKSLDVALKEIDSNSFVLKTRPDLLIERDFLDNLFNNKNNLLKIKNGLPRDNVFKYKVWIPYFEITSPFHIADECFFGYHKDISLLVNFNNYFEEYGLRAGIVHIQRYIHPFIFKYPEIKNFFLGNSDVGFPKDLSYSYKMMKKIFQKNNLTLRMFDSVVVNNRFRILRRRFKEQGYIEILALYYAILHTHFYVNNQGIDNDINNQTLFNRNSAPKVLTDDPEIMKNFSKDRIWVKTKGQIYSGDEEFLKNIFEKRMQQNNKTADRLLEAINKFKVS